MCFVHRRAALQHLIRDERSSIEAVEEMQEKLGHEGWSPNDNLPKGWLLRMSSAKKKIKLFTREGNVLFAYKEAIEYMSSLSYYTTQDLLKLKSLFDETLHEQKLKQTLTSGWKGREGLPPGWKAKNGKKKLIHLLSPSGKCFFNTRKALQHMVRLFMTLGFDIQFLDCQWVSERGYQAYERGTELGWLGEGGGAAQGLESEKTWHEQCHFLLD